MEASEMAVSKWNGVVVAYQLHEHRRDQHGEVFRVAMFILHRHQLDAGIGRTETLCQLSVIRAGAGGCEWSPRRRRRYQGGDVGRASFCATTEG